MTLDGARRAPASSGTSETVCETTLKIGCHAIIRGPRILRILGPRDPTDPPPKLKKQSEPGRNLWI